jgi:hypothetical protein
MRDVADVRGEQWVGQWRCAGQGVVICGLMPGKQGCHVYMHWDGCSASFAVASIVYNKYKHYKCNAAHTSTGSLKPGALIAVLRAVQLSRQPTPLLCNICSEASWI